LVTLACGGDCADVLAVARGGNPDYHFLWNDSVVTTMRRICVREDTSFRLSVTDTELPSGEFACRAHTVSADVTADVLQCPDESDLLCISNPSFEGSSPGPTELVNGFVAPPWQTCDFTPDIWNEQQSWDGTPGAPAPSDGRTYLAFLQFRWLVLERIHRSRVVRSIERGSPL
jgi:hypothetical protein